MRTQTGKQKEEWNSEQEKLVSRPEPVARLHILNRAGRSRRDGNRLGMNTSEAQTSGKAERAPNGNLSHSLQSLLDAENGSRADVTATMKA
jgi:hypothetical protein